MKRVAWFVVIISMLPSLVFGGEINSSALKLTPQSRETLLSPQSAAQEEKMVVAHITEADKEALRAAEAEEHRKGHTWDTFWDVHFGGYRWAWWALAGAVLIGIHAGAN